MGRDMAACAGACVKIKDNLEHCGACGNRCPEVPNGTPECNGDTCRVRCNSGFKDCGGACVDITSDPAHCDGCGKACAGLCVLGKCVPAL
jgi:hypothetical protein